MNRSEIVHALIALGERVEKSADPEALRADLLRIVKAVEGLPDSNEVTLRKVNVHLPAAVAAEAALLKAALRAKGLPEVL